MEAVAGFEFPSRDCEKKTPVAKESAAKILKLRIAAVVPASVVLLLAQTSFGLGGHMLLQAPGETWEGVVSGGL